MKMKRKMIGSILLVVLGICLFAIIPAFAQNVIWKPISGAAQSTSIVELRNPVLEHGLIQLGNKTGKQDPSLGLNSAATATPIVMPTAIPAIIQQPVVYPTAVPPRLPYDCAVSVNSPYFYQQFSPGQDFDFDVTFTNTGTQQWDTDIDVVQYTGYRMEIEGRYRYDIDKDYGSARIVRPGESIRWKIRMEAPKDGDRSDKKYFSTYYLIRGTDMENGRFCPFSAYVYVP